jgi:uncharacterized membrane protein YczE
LHWELFLYWGFAWLRAARCFDGCVGKRLPKVPIGIVRGVIEGTVLLIGWLLGAKVGIGTVISVFGISFILEATFNILHFDVTNIEHESIVDTVRTL